MPGDRETRAQQRLERRRRRLEEGLRRRQEHLRRRVERGRARSDRGDDGDTRRRLLEVASRLFAERGLDGVTVREICRDAAANVAAINYHFGDKLGLYAEVVGMAIGSMRRAHAPTMAEGGSPEERLGGYIHGQLQRVLEVRQDSWVFRLMQNELVNPTPGLDRVVREVIRPRVEWVGKLVAELLGCSLEDSRVGTVVANVHGLPMLIARKPIVARLLPDWKPTPEAIRTLAEQTTRFVLAGIRALADAGPGERGR